MACRQSMIGLCDASYMATRQSDRCAPRLVARVRPIQLPRLALPPCTIYLQHRIGLVSCGDVLRKPLPAQPALFSPTAVSIAIGSHINPTYNEQYRTFRQQQKTVAVDEHGLVSYKTRITLHNHLTHNAPPHNRALLSNLHLAPYTRLMRSPLFSLFFFWFLAIPTT